MRKALLLIAVFGLVGTLWAADHFAGNWKLDPSKTKITGAVSADKSGTATITPQANGYKMVYDVVDSAGKAYHVELSVKLDGKDYPAIGAPTFDAISVHRIDDFTEDRVLKKSGKEVATQHVVLSKDGKTATLTQKSKDEKGKDITAISVWIKQ